MAALTGMAGYDLPFVGEQRDWRDDWIIVGAVAVFATLHCTSYFPNMAISMMMKMFEKIAESAPAGGKPELNAAALNHEDYYSNGAEQIIYDAVAEE